MRLYLFSSHHLGHDFSGLILLLGEHSSRSKRQQRRGNSSELHLCNVNKGKERLSCRTLALQENTAALYLLRGLRSALRTDSSYRSPSSVAVRDIEITMIPSYRGRTVPNDPK